MQYIPFGPGLRGIPNIMVDSGRTPQTVLELSHWPGNRTPTSFKADTSTEIVLRFLRSPMYITLTRETHVVSNDHYDIDGLLSVWALLNPELALKWGQLVVEAATTGDFDRFTSPRAVQFCLTLNAIERIGIQPLLSRSRWTTEDVTGFINRQLLPVVSDCLERPECYRHLWAQEYREVEESQKSLTSGSARITELPDLDLAIVESERPLHDYAVYAATDRLRVLTVSGRQTYCLRYRYESFVEVTSRAPTPRIRLDALVKRLNELETVRGCWAAETVATAHPRLQLYTSSGAPSHSGIPLDRFLDEVTQHLRLGDRTLAMQWRNTDEWVSEEDAAVPPSLLR